MARPAKVELQTSPIIQRLDILAGLLPELAEPIAFYREVLPLLQEAQATVTPFTLPADTAQLKLAAGFPLLVGEDLPLDPDTTRDLFFRLCRTVEEVGRPTPRKSSGWLFRFASRNQPDPAQLLEQVHNGDEAVLRATAARQIRYAVEEGQLDLLAIWSALAAGDIRSVELAARELKLETELLRVLALSSLKPALRVWARGLDDLVDLDRWLRGSCPLCGSPPTLAEIQGKEGARRLRCALCGSGWYYPRLQCAFCSNSNHRSLGYISVDGEEEKYRIQVCNECHGYMKIIVTFEPTPADLLPVEDLATLHLDLIADERHYMRVPVG